MWKSSRLYNLGLFLREVASEMATFHHVVPRVLARNSLAMHTLRLGQGWIQDYRLKQSRELRIFKCSLGQGTFADLPQGCTDWTLLQRTVGGHKLDGAVNAASPARQHKTMLWMRKLKFQHVAAAGTSPVATIQAQPTFDAAQYWVEIETRIPNPSISKTPPPLPAS